MKAVQETTSRFVAAAQGGDAQASSNRSAEGTNGDPNTTKKRDQTPSPLRFIEQRVGRRTVLTAVGEVDISTAADLRRTLETAGDACASEIWLDLTQTTFMDCSGLHVLLDLRASLRETNRRLVVICPAGPVLRLLTLTRADRELEIHPTRTAARQAN